MRGLTKGLYNLLISTTALDLSPEELKKILPAGHHASAVVEHVAVNFQIDLAELETCSRAVLKNIEKDGKPL